MFAIIAAFVFVLATFGVQLGKLNMIAMGLVFLCLHFIFGGLFPALNFSRRTIVKE